MIKIIAVVFFLIITYSKIAYAEFRLCNDTQGIVTVALSYQDKSEWVTKGWWRVAPLNCSALIKESLKARFYYLHAEDAKNEGRWEGPIFLCVKDEKFNITGVKNCYVRGFQKAGFQEIDTLSQANWTVHLKDKKSN